MSLSVILNSLLFASSLVLVAITDFAFLYQQA